ncbi:MAG: T9SS type A sorting domain-containing protein, partial [Candidatus Eisenbacteria bacterium]|nr:T9SS type A sorting domain-containing protein [Candidatus Eisenbacteria bacterium]
VLAMNYETTRFAPPAKESPCSGTMTASLALSQTGGVIEARVLLQGNPDCLLGASVRLAYDPALEFVAAAAGDLWPQGQSFFDAATPRSGELVLDAAALGAVVSGEGCHAVARFRAGTAGEAAPRIAIAQFRARGTGNADLAGGFSPQGVAGDVAAPRVHRLLGSQPSPAIAGAWIHYQLAGEERVSLQLFDATGRRVRTLVEGVQTAGEHRLLWDGRRADGSPAEPGVYFCRLEAGEVVSTRRLMLVR